MWLQFWKAVSQISIWLLAKKTAFTLHYSLICLEGRNMGEKVTVLAGGWRVMWVSWHYCQGISIHRHWICIYPSSLSIQFFYSLQWCNETSVIIFCILAPNQKIINICFNTNMSMKLPFMILWNTSCAECIPKESLKDLHLPNGVFIVVNLVLSSSKGVCQYPFFASNFVKWVALPILLKCLQMWFVGNALS